MAVTDYDSLSNDGMRDLILKLTKEEVPPDDSGGPPAEGLNVGASRESSEQDIPRAALAVIVMLLMPLVAVISVAVHWFAVGRKMYRGRG